MATRYDYDSNGNYLGGRDETIPAPVNAAGYAAVGPSSSEDIWNGSTWVQATSSDNPKLVESLLSKDFANIYATYKDNPAVTDNLKDAIINAELAVGRYAEFNDLASMKRVINTVKTQLPTGLKPLADQLLTRFKES